MKNGDPFACVLRSEEINRTKISHSKPKDVNEILDLDLDMTMSFLREHPKVYWIWNHRRWCLENVPECPDEETRLGWRKAVWKKEMRAVEMMLDVDARNCMHLFAGQCASANSGHRLVHAWNYRRYVLASMPEKTLETKELEYTTRKIEANFSNFSAWHQRSKVYTSLWSQGTLDEHECKEKGSSKRAFAILSSVLLTAMCSPRFPEFELVKQALYVDPYDQSSWLYHRWLIGSGEPLSIM